MLVALPFSLFAQQMKLCGRVLDGDFDNAPLVGATVKVEYGGSQNMQGTSTDLDGKFSLEISTAATEFSVSFIGCTCKCTRAQGREVHSFNSVFNSADVTDEHHSICAKMMCKHYRLSTLKMSISGKDCIFICFRLNKNC